METLNLCRIFDEGVGAYVRDKNTSARLSDFAGGGVFAGHYGKQILFISKHIVLINKHIVIDFIVSVSVGGIASSSLFPLSLSSPLIPSSPLPFSLPPLPSPPLPLPSQHYSVVDASQGQVFIAVYHSFNNTNLYLSEEQGLNYSLSLEYIISPPESSWYNPTFDVHVVSIEWEVGEGEGGGGGGREGGEGRGELTL